MKKYKKETPRLSVQYVNADTEEVLFEINNRTWMNVGELLTDAYVNKIVEKELTGSGINAPKNLMVLIVGEYKLID